MTNWRDTVMTQTELYDKVAELEYKLGILRDELAGAVNAEIAMRDERDAALSRLDSLTRENEHIGSALSEANNEKNDALLRLHSLVEPLTSLIHYARDTGYRDSDVLDELCKYIVVETPAPKYPSPDPRGGVCGWDDGKAPRELRGVPTEFNRAVEPAVEIPAQKELPKEAKDILYANKSKLYTRE